MTQTNTPDPAFDEPMSEAEWEAAQAWTDHAHHLVGAFLIASIDRGESDPAFVLHALLGATLNLMGAYGGAELTARVVRDELAHWANGQAQGRVPRPDDEPTAEQRTLFESLQAFRRQMMIDPNGMLAARPFEEGPARTEKRWQTLAESLVLQLMPEDGAAVLGLGHRCGPRRTDMHAVLKAGGDAAAAGYLAELLVFRFPAPGAHPHGSA